MPKRHKKKIDDLTTKITEQCVISPKPSTSSTPADTISPKPSTSSTPADTISPKPSTSSTPADTISPKPSTSSTPANIIPPKPRTSHTGVTILDDKIDRNVLAKWPKLKMKVPPIFLHHPVELESHVRKLLSRGIKFYQPHHGNNYIKIVCESFNDHKHLTRYLDKNQLPFHTYGNPSNRKMRVVIRDLPDKLDLDIIKGELKSHSIPVIRVHKMKTGGGGKPNTMLVLAVVPYDDNGKQILRIKQLLGHEVVLEPPKDKPKQCYRCQKWGHAQRYCHGRITCVKCAGDHLSKKCEKSPDEEPKCANCEEAHTASYRECLYTRGSLDFTMMQDLELITPCYKPRVLVTYKNFETLYRNFDYSTKAGK